MPRKDLVKNYRAPDSLVDLRTGPLPELQDLLNPELLDKALSEMDTDDDGSISKDE